MVYGFICRFHVGKEKQMEITNGSIWEIENRLEERFSTNRVNVEFVIHPKDDLVKIVAKVDNDRAYVCLDPREVTPAVVADALIEKIEEQRAAKWSPVQPPKPGTGGIGIEAPRMTVLGFKGMAYNAIADIVGNPWEYFDEDETADHMRIATLGAVYGIMLLTESVCERLKRGGAEE